MTDKIVKQLVGRIMEKTITTALFYEAADIRRQLFLRASSLPYCSLKHINQLATKGLPKLNQYDFAKTFYLKSGHNIHEIFQAMMPNAVDKDIATFGDWACDCPKKETASLTVRQKCSCGKWMNYVEVEIRYRKVLLGHIDKILRVKYRGEYYYIVIDFKTTGDATTAHTGLGYKQQLLTYTYYLDKILKLPILGCALVYIERRSAREKTGWRVVPIAYDAAKVKPRILRQVRDYETVVRMRSSSTKTLKTLIQERYCRTEADYKKHMETFEPCPMLKQCTRQSDKELLETMEEILENATDENVFPLVHHPKATLLKKALNIV